MSQFLCITLRFIQPFPVFHGRDDSDQPEWPPSPMRAFQALVNAASLRVRGCGLDHDVKSAIEVLERNHPLIVAPVGNPATVGYRTYVPHNQTDLVTAAWHRGNSDASMASHRMEKDIRPTQIEVSTNKIPAVHYVYPLDASHGECRQILNTIRPSVRSIVAIGWGIDQIAADATLVTETGAAELRGEHWRPISAGGRRLRVARPGSLDALQRRYVRFLNRLCEGDWTPVPPLTAMDIVSYGRDSDPAPRPHAVFKLLDENEDTFRYPHAKLVHIAGMVRHMSIKAMEPDQGNPPPGIKNPADWVNRVVRGKRDESSGDEHKQFSYVPLPSIGHAHSDAMVRNVMIVAPLGMEHELDYLAGRLDGQILTPEGEHGSCETESTPGVSHRIELQKFTPPRGKFIDKCYLGTSRIWQSVTPVILDGHNDKKAGKTVKLIQTALQRAGIETPCEFAWQAYPYYKNCLSAHKYDREGRHVSYHRPKHLKHQTALHVRIEFTHAVPGPITLGAGRHCGFGLMAAID